MHNIWSPSSKVLNYLLPFLCSKYTFPNTLFRVGIFQINVYTFSLSCHSDPTAAIPARPGKLCASIWLPSPGLREASSPLHPLVSAELGCSATSLHHPTCFWDLAPTKGIATTLWAHRFHQCHKWQSLLCWVGSMVLPTQCAFAPVSPRVLTPRLLCPLDLDTLSRNRLLTGTHLSSLTVSLG